MDKKTIYNNYYELFIKKFETLISDIKKPTHQNGRHYINIKSENGISYYCEYTSKGYSSGKYPGFIVGLYMDGKTYKDKYELFLKYKDEIDELFDNDIIWLDTGKAGRIFFRYEANIETNKNKWLEIMKWQINKVQKLLDYIPQYIQKINIKINFDNITQQDILQAFAKYDDLDKNNKLEKNRKRKDYILFYNSKEYPHKYIVGIAYGIRNKTTTLDSQQYYSTGSQKYSAEWCINKNGFELYFDGKYRKYLENKYQNKNTVNTYYSDLKKAIKIFQNIPILKEKNLTSILETMIDGSINYDIYDKAQQELGFNDKQLFSTLKTKAKEYLEAISTQIQKSKKKDIEMLGSQDKQPLNQILYGPPGTGKTYRTVNKALEIIFDQNKECDNATKSKEEEYKVTYQIQGCKTETKGVTYQQAIENDDRVALKAIFDDFQKKGQIEFVTFHQSYGYEEFVEGIKPCGLDDCDSKNNVNIKYSVQSGIFKKLCRKARLDIAIEMLKNKLHSNNTIKLKTEGQTKDFQVKETNDSSFLLSTSKDSEQDIRYKDLYLLLNNRSNGVHNPSYTKPLFDYLMNLKISKQIKSKNYILIIDEINRGNISKIFGELITLIESSRRIGEDEEIMLKLPNSGDDFGVPSNLYIIGTMNTADRSIAQIDTALRRRFEFVEMMPKPELLVNQDKSSITITHNKTDTGINIREVLSAINERIEYIADREHTIGHSYFMSLINTPTKEKLDEIFRVNIIPLLAEYFYEDWNDIKIILNDTKDKSEFITKREKPIYQITDKKSNNNIYSVNENTFERDGFSISGYRNIYVKREIAGDK